MFKMIAKYQIEPGIEDIVVKEKTGYLTGKILDLKIREFAANSLGFDATTEDPEEEALIRGRMNYWTVEIIKDEEWKESMDLKDATIVQHYFAEMLKGTPEENADVMMEWIGTDECQKLADSLKEEPTYDTDLEY